MEGTKPRKIQVTGKSMKVQTNFHVWHVLRGNVMNVQWMWCHQCCSGHSSGISHFLISIPLVPARWTLAGPCREAWTAPHSYSGHFQLDNWWTCDSGHLRLVNWWTRDPNWANQTTGVELRDGVLVLFLKSRDINLGAVGGLVDWKAGNTVL